MLVASLLVSLRCVSAFSCRLPNHGCFILLAIATEESHFFPWKLSINIAEWRTYEESCIFFAETFTDQSSGRLSQIQTCLLYWSTDFAQLIIFFNVFHTHVHILLCIGNHCPNLYFSLQFGLEAVFKSKSVSAYCCRLSSVGGGFR